MSAPEVTDRVVEAIDKQEFDTIIVNYANGDMVGHTGVFQAAVQAVECLDECLGRITSALERVGGEALITADLGNCEQMTDHHTGQAIPHTRPSQCPSSTLASGRPVSVLAVFWPMLRPPC